MPKRYHTLLALLVFTLALVLRLLYLKDLMHLPFFNHPIMDAAYHDSWARRIAQGQLVGDEPFFRAPLYPYVLGLIYKLSHGSYLIPRILQFLIGSFTSLFVFLLAKRLVGTAGALIAGFLCAIYPVLIYFDGEILTESLFIFFSVVSLYLLEIARSGKRKMWLFAGITLGLALITRPTIGLFLPLALFGCFLFSRKFTLLLLVGIIIPVMPVTLHNYFVSGEFIPVVWQAGINFYLGNNAQANGWSATSPEIRKDWWGGYNDMIAIPKSVMGREPSYGEVSSYWTSRALAFIRNNPGRWAKLVLKKIALFWSSLEFPNNQDYNFVRATSTVLRNPLVRFATIAPIGLVGLLVAIVNWRKYFFVVAFVITYFVATVAFFVCARYRVPIVPALCLLAAVGLIRIVSLARRRSYTKFLAHLGLVCGFALIVNLNLTGEHLPGLAQSYTQVGKVLVEEGKTSEALRYFEKALDVNPSWPEAYEQIGLLKMKSNDFEAAVRFLSKAVEISPDMATAHRALAMIYLRQGQLEMARQAIEKSLKYAPFIEDGYNLLATIERQEGNLGHAEELFKKEIEIHPDNWRAWVNLGSLYQEQGRLEEAAQAYEKALKIVPDNSDVALALASTYAGLGKEDEAHEIVEKLNPQAAANINLRYNQAVILQNSGRMEEAKAIYENILKQDPRHEGALVNLGVIYAKTGKPEEARNLWQKALEINPSNATAKRNLELLKKRQ